MRRLGIRSGGRCCLGRGFLDGGLGRLSLHLRQGIGIGIKAFVFKITIDQRFDFGKLRLDCLG